MNRSLVVALAGALGLAVLITIPGFAAEDKPDATKAADAKKADGDGWIATLEGGDLAKHWVTTGNWKLTDGVVQLEPREGEKGWTRWSAYLWLKDKQYKDFQIQFDYKVAKGGNSGFYFHVGDMNDPVAKGIEVQIYDSGAKKPEAKLTDHDSGGVIPGVPPKKNTAKPAGEWNHFNITVKGETATIELNGEVVNEVDLSKGGVGAKPKTGYIGFQDHGLPLWLKDIKIREL